MLLPAFTCDQDDAFVRVRIVLSALCKVTDALFDISNCQFTFACKPYYLRLKFTEPLTEDKGERATYDVESNTLVVYLPKANAGQAFAHLDNPAFLLATDKQRTQLVQVLSSSYNSNDNDKAQDDGDGEEDEEETEYVQTLTSVADNGGGGDDKDDDGGAATSVSYGFANLFTGLFAKLDADLVREMIALPDPEHTSATARRTLRIQREQIDFDEEAVLVAFEDADGEVARLLRYVPTHMYDLQRALRADVVVAAATATAPSTQQQQQDDDGGGGAHDTVADVTAVQHTDDADEEEAVPLRVPQQQRGTPVEVWCGNVGQFTPPPPLPVTTTTSSTAAAPPSCTTIDGDGGNDAAVADTQQTTMTTASTCAADNTTTATTLSAAKLRLAVPRHRPALTLRADEAATLAQLPLPRMLCAPCASTTLALTVDLLLAEAYDDLVTEGGGCSESLWNVCTLSSALSYLDVAETVYDACVTFARRVLVYPLHRHFALVQRAMACVGARMLLGRLYVVRALLRVRHVLAHAEHKHLLATLYCDPLIGYWMNTPHADALLTRGAAELHAHAARTQCEVVRVTSSASSAAAEMTCDGASTAALRASSLLSQPRTRTLQPLTLLTLGLPLCSAADDDDDGEEEGDNTPSLHTCAH